MENINIEKAIHMVCKEGYSYEEVYQLLSAADQIVFSWAVIA